MHIHSRLFWDIEAAELPWIFINVQKTSRALAFAQIFRDADLLWAPFRVDILGIYDRKALLFQELCEYALPGDEPAAEAAVIDLLHAAAGAAEPKSLPKPE